MKIELNPETFEFIKEELTRVLNDCDATLKLPMCQGEEHTVIRNYFLQRQGEIITALKALGVVK